MDGSGLYNIRDVFLDWSRVSFMDHFTLVNFICISEMCLQYNQEN